MHFVIKYEQPGTLTVLSKLLIVIWQQ